MDTFQLQCFLKIAETLSFSKAAELLYTSQPVISYQLKTLETELNLKLVVRNKRSVKLTPSGVSFYKNLLKIDDQINQAILEARSAEMKAHSKICIGLWLFDCDYLSKPINDFRECHKAIDVTVHTADIETSNYSLHNNKVDAHFVYQNNASYSDPIFEYRHLDYKQIYCLMNQSHPLATKNTIQLKDLENYSVIIPYQFNDLSPVIDIRKAIDKDNININYNVNQSFENGYTMLRTQQVIVLRPCHDIANNPLIISKKLDSPYFVSFGLLWKKSNKLKEITIFENFFTQYFSKVL